MTDFPRGIQVDTKFGAVFLNVNSGTFITVSDKFYGPGGEVAEQALIVNRVPITNLRADFHLRGGMWQLGESDQKAYQAINLKRDNWDDVSFSARRKVKEECTRVVRAWAEENPALLIQAARADRDARAAVIERQIADHLEEARQLDAALRDVRGEAVCYSDHNEDIRTKGSCALCRGTELD